MATNDPLSWRFIPLIVASGQLQMAIDAWLLHELFWEPLSTNKLASIRESIEAKIAKH